MWTEGPPSLVSATHRLSAALGCCANPAPNLPSPPASLVSCLSLRWSCRHEQWWGLCLSHKTSSSHSQASRGPRESPVDTLHPPSPNS